MEISDWILLISTVILAAAALIAPYLAEKLKRSLYPPKLKILFNFCPPFCHKTSWNTNPREFVYYFRLQVINEGKSQARLCEVVLEKLWIYDSYNKPKLYSNFSPVNMNWVGSTNEYININPKRMFFCDIGHISSPIYQTEKERNNFLDIIGYKGKDLRFVLDLNQIFLSQPNCFPPGKYKLQIGLYSENADYQNEFFNISWSGKWSEEKDEMFREIVIERSEYSN